MLLQPFDLDDNFLIVGNKVLFRVIVLLATYAIIYECWKRKNFKVPSAMRKSFQFETRSITYVEHNFPHTVTNKAIAETTNLSTLHTDKF